MARRFMGFVGGELFQIREFVLLVVFPHGEVVGITFGTEGVAQKRTRDVLNPVSGFFIEWRVNDLGDGAVAQDAEVACLDVFRRSCTA